MNYKFSLIILTETRFCAGNGLYIDGYKGWHSGRDLGGGGGVSLFCDSGISAYQITNLSFVNEAIEVYTVRVEICSRIFVIVAIYRPPSGSIIEFTNSLLLTLVSFYLTLLIIYQLLLLSRIYLLLVTN